MKPVLGGIRMPRVPPAEMAPQERVRLYLYLSISGRQILPMLAVVAVAEPQMAPKKAQATSVAMARPPRTRLTHL